MSNVFVCVTHDRVIRGTLREHRKNEAERQTTSRDTHYTRAVMPSEDLLETRLTAPLNLFFIVAVWRLYSDVRML